MGRRADARHHVALDCLERAAQLRLDVGATRTAILAHDSGATGPRLRRRIDSPHWTTSPAVRIVFDRPRVIVIEQFMSAAECEWLIQRGRPGLARAMVYRGSFTPQAADTRTNTETSFTIFNADVMLNLLRERMSSATRAATSFFEVTKLLHYEPGQQFALHADFLQPNTPELVQEIQLRGQRAATFLTYLNDDYEGGETEFPRIQFRFKGKRGDALLFSNTDRAGARTTTRFTQDCRPRAARNGCCRSGSEPADDAVRRAVARADSRRACARSIDIDVGSVRAGSSRRGAICAA